MQKINTADMPGINSPEIPIISTEGVGGGVKEALIAIYLNTIHLQSPTHTPSRHLNAVILINETTQIKHYKQMTRFTPHYTQAKSKTQSREHSTSANTQTINPPPYRSSQKCALNTRLHFNRQQRTMFSAQVASAYECFLACVQSSFSVCVMGSV